MTPRNSHWYYDNAYGGGCQEASWFEPRTFGKSSINATFSLTVLVRQTRPLR